MKKTIHVEVWLCYSLPVWRNGCLDLRGEEAISYQQATDKEEWIASYINDNGIDNSWEYWEVEYDNVTKEWDNDGSGIWIQWEV